MANAASNVSKGSTMSAYFGASARWSQDWVWTSNPPKASTFPLTTCPLKTWTLSQAPGSMLKTLSPAVPQERIGCHFMRNDSSLPVAPFRKFLSGHALNMHSLFHNAFALENVWNLTIKFIKDLQHALQVTAFQRLCQFSLTHWQIRKDIISMLKTTKGLPHWISHRPSYPPMATQSHL